jgi:hypothetical protein
VRPVNDSTFERIVDTLITACLVVTVLSVLAALTLGFIAAAMAGSQPTLTDSAGMYILTALVFGLVTVGLFSIPSGTPKRDS